MKCHSAHSSLCENRKSAIITHAPTAAAAVPLPHTKAVASPADSADAILHLAIANVAKQAMKKQQQQQPHAQLPSAAAAEHSVADVAALPSSPSAAATAILKADLSRAEHNQPAAPKTGLSVPFAPLKVRTSPILPPINANLSKSVDVLPTKSFADEACRRRRRLTRPRTRYRQRCKVCSHSRVISTVPRVRVSTTFQR